MLSPVGAKYHPCPLPWTYWGHFSPALHCLQQCVMQGVSSLWVILLWVLCSGCRGHPEWVSGPSQRLEHWLGVP